jgi:hypothetical protein
MGANPHISVSKQNADPGTGPHPLWLHCLEMTDSFYMLGIFAIGKFLQVIMHFLRSPSSLKVRLHVVLSDIFHFSQLLHRLIATPVFKVA